MPCAPTLTVFTAVFYKVGIAHEYVKCPPNELLRAMPRSSLRRETRLQDFSPPYDLWSNHVKGAVSHLKIALAIFD